MQALPGTFGVELYELSLWPWPKHHLCPQSHETTLQSVQVKRKNFCIAKIKCHTNIKKLRVQ